MITKEDSKEQQHMAGIAYVCIFYFYNIFYKSDVTHKDFVQ